MTRECPDIEPGGAPVPEPPGELRVLTYDDATSTSECIGNPVTPVCVAETWEACFQRRKSSLCQTIGRTIEFARPGISQRVVRQRRMNYKILAVEPIVTRTSSEAAARPSVFDPDPQRDWRAGDVAVQIKRQHCWPDRCGVWSREPKTFITRRIGNRWILVDMYVPRY